MTGDTQRSTEEFIKQPSLPSSPCFPAKMQASIVDYGPPSLPPESHEQSYPYPNLKVVEEVQIVGTVVSRNHSNILTSSHRYKWTGRWMVKRLAICKSPFVAQCLKLFPKISHQDRLVADFALVEDVDPRQFLYFISNPS